jgi:hypothetical protein
MNFPKELVAAVRKHKIVPFVGAGVSMGVKPGLFPSWIKLLEELGQRMQEELLPDSALTEMQKLIAQKDYLAAAEFAFQELGPFRFNRYLRERIRVRQPGDADLSVIRAMWELQPSVVITPNYDDVLLWAREDAEPVSNDQEDELNFMGSDASPESPRVWFLHGTIHRLATVVLAGADYKRLYGDASQPASYSQYKNALVRLHNWILDRPFLYMGFSFSDPYVLKQLEHVIGITKGRGVPSFALMKKGQIDRGALWPKYNIQLVEYEDHGRPLAEFLRGLAQAAFGGSRVSLTLESLSATPTPGELPPVVRPTLEQEYARILRNQHRLVLLAPEDGGARALARRVAAQYGERVTWLAPPNVPDCTEAEYCRALAGEDPDAGSVTSFDALVQHLRKRAARLGRDHLIVLRYEWGPFDHLTALGRHLRTMMDEPSAVQFHFLIAGGERSAWLLHNMKSFSVFKDAPRREVPDLTVDEVRQFLDAAGHKGSRWAQSVHEATGGHIGLLREVLSSDGSLDADSVTARLVRGPSLRGTVQECLRQDERNGYTGERSCQSVLTKLLAGQEVQDLEPLDNQVEYPEVRLYFAGLVRSDATGKTVLRCKAVELAAREALARKDVRP